VRRISLLLILSCTIFLCSKKVVQAADTARFLHVDQISRGMKGMGRTVFQGTKIDTFQVEIIGILKNYLGPRSDMILARLEGGPLEKTGVMPGMSGSPVYIDGKLIGAVAYTWSFAKEPIAGITPIHSMLRLFRREDNSEQSPGTGQTSMFGSSGSDIDPSLVGDLKPVGTPLVMSGFAPQAISDLRKELLPAGFFPIQGGGASDSTLPTSPFEAGAAVGVQLVRGDFSMTAIGTLTHRDGDRVLALGHPMLSTGNTSLPMTSAYIHGIMPSQFLSFKMGTATSPQGTILQDRAQGVSGKVGEMPAMMPASIEILSSGGTQRFKIEVLRNRDFTPILLRTAVASALISSEKLMGETTVAAKGTILLEDRAPVVVENVYAGPTGLGLAVLGLTTPVNRLMRNPFESVQVEEITLSLRVEERARAGRIASVRFDRTQVKAGETIGIAVDIREYLGESHIVNTSLDIPEQARGSRLVLHITSASAYVKTEAKRVPDEYRAKDLDQLIRILGRVERNDTLILQLLSTRTGVTVEGREVSTLPHSVMSAMQHSSVLGSVRPVRQTVMTEVRIPTDMVLSGSQTVMIIVDQERNGVIFAGKAGPAGGKK
jgi:hypothetical protein